MSTQPKTEQLADELENTPFQSTRYEAASELRRLEAANAELVDALNWLDKWIGEKPLIECANRVRKAIAKHGGK